MFSSGMASISTVIATLNYYKRRYKRADGRTLRLDWLGGYYEMQRLIALMDNSDIYCRYIDSLDTQLDRLSSGKTDILFFEPVLYDWTQTVIDPHALIQALEARPVDRPWILMVDSTLLGATFDLEALLLACGSRWPLLALELRSGVKLDQHGLEFSNIGIVKIATHPELDVSKYPSAKAFRDKLGLNRMVMGTSLSLDETAILDLPSLFHPEWARGHVQKIFDNNRELAIALTGIAGLFVRVNHPGLGPQRDSNWAESPFVVMEFHLEEDTRENHAFLLKVIDLEARSRSLTFYRGVSFGFRHHRCEVVVSVNTFPHPNGQMRGFFKVAAGARRGPSFVGMVALLRELAGYVNFQTLRQRYAGQLEG
ncbi:MAG: hypothetical protein HQM00_06475 [Magnetococcales bacterium]|nr:hypothetical protein [Magnetococcales bacterium]